MPPANAFELAPPIAAQDHALGPARDGVAVVEYGDFECPNCKQAAAVVKLLLAEFKDHLRFAYRHFPLEEVHPHALGAAQAAECAGAQGKFWPMHDLLFEHQHALKGHQLRGYAEQLELDMARFKSEMNGTVYLPRIREHQRSALASGVRATPTFFLNGSIQDVSFGPQSLFDAVKRALAASLL